MKNETTTAATATTQPNQHNQNNEPTLNQYIAFHGMLCSPSTASSCVKSFRQKNGCIFFGPSSVVVSSSDGSNADDFRPYDYSNKLTTFWYYVLCIAAGFSLCTYLGYTDFIDGREFTEKETTSTTTNHVSENDALLQSKVVPHEIRATNAVLSYVQNHITRNSSSSSSLSSSPPPLRLKRRFEYDFKLCFCNVIMLHFVSSSPPPPQKGREEEDDEEEVLHLVEVYNFRNPVAQRLASMLRFLTSIVLDWITFLEESFGMNAQVVKNEDSFKKRA